MRQVEQYRSIKQPTKDLCLPCMPLAEQYRSLAAQSDEKRARAEDELLTTAR
jgi:hypothetical protein